MKEILPTPKKKSRSSSDGSPADLLKRNGSPLTVKKAVQTAIHILRELEVLYSQGTIHGSLTPTDVIFENGNLRLTNDCISRQTSPNAGEAVAADAGYAAPEFLAGRHDSQADIWAVGVILYEMLAGSQPFPQDSFNETDAATFRQPEPLPTHLLPQLQQIVLKALATETEPRYSDPLSEFSGRFPALPNAAVRYPTAKRMREDLEEILLLIESPELLLGVTPCDHFGSRFTEGLAGFTVDGWKWGFIDENANVAVVPRYDRVSDFYHGSAIVKLNGKSGLIDKKGEILVDFGEYDEISSSSDGISVVHNEKHGLLDYDGKVIIAPQYESLDSFSDGRARIWVNGKIGFIDENDNLVIAPQYEVAHAFSENLAAVQVDGQWGFINQNGEVVISPQYNSVSHFQEGFARITVSSLFDKILDKLFRIFGLPPKLGLINRFGFIDKNGKVVVKPVYSVADLFSENLAAVKKWGKWGFIDGSGKVAVALKYSSAKSFKKGMAIVSMRSIFSIKSRYGIIDENEEVAIELKYDSIREAFGGGGGDILELTLKGERRIVSKSGLEFSKRYQLDKET